MSKIFKTHSLEGLTTQKYIDEALRRNVPALRRTGISRDFFLSREVGHNDLNDLDRDERRRDTKIIEVAKKLGLNPAIIYWVAKHDVLMRHSLRMFALREASDGDFFVRMGAVEMPDIFPGQNFYHAMHNAIMGLELRRAVRGQFCTIVNDLRAYRKAAEGDIERVPPKSFPPRGFNLLADMLQDELDPANKRGMGALLGLGLKIFFGHIGAPRLAFFSAPDGTLLFPPTIGDASNSAYEPDGSPIEKKTSLAKYSAPLPSKTAMTAVERSRVFVEYWNKNERELRRHFDIVEVQAAFRDGNGGRAGEPVTIGAVMAPDGFTSPVKEIWHMIETAERKGLAKDAGKKLKGILEGLSINAAASKNISSRTYNELAEFLYDAFRLQDVTTIPAIIKALKICFNHLGARDHLPLVVEHFGEKRFAAPTDFSRVSVGNDRLERLALDSEYVWEGGAVTPAEYFRRRAILLRRDFEILPASFRDEMPRTRNFGAIAVPDGFSSVVTDIGQALAEIHLGGVKGLRMADDLSAVIQGLVGGTRADYTEAELSQAAGILLTLFELRGRQVTWQDCFSALLLYTNRDSVLDFLPLVKKGNRIIYGRSSVLANPYIHCDIKSAQARCIDGDYMSSQMEMDVLLGRVQAGKGAPGKMLEMFGVESLFDKMKFVIDRSFGRSNRKFMLGLAAHVIRKRQGLGPEDLRMPVFDLLKRFEAKAESAGLTKETGAARKLQERLLNSFPETGTQGGGGAGTTACHVSQSMEPLPTTWPNGCAIGAGAFIFAPAFHAMAMPFTFV